MNKAIFFTVFITLIIIILSFLRIIYLPVDILNLLPIFHSEASSVPHNTLVSDPIFQFEPWRYFTKNLLSDGVFPLWNNLNGGGVPLFANAISAIIFPLNFVYYIFPIYVSLNLIPILKLFLLFTFMYLYLQSVRISKGISVLGGIALCFSGFPIVWLLWPHTNVYIFLPLFLYLTEKIRNTKAQQKKWYALLSVSYCFAILGGHYETLLHMMILHIPYFFIRMEFKIRKIATILLFIFLGILLSSIQLIPFLEYFFNSWVRFHRFHSPYLYLPLESVVLNFIPFLLGAPHIKYYKPIVSVTNFQESIGGYTGLIVLLIAIYGSFFLWKKFTMVKIWSLFAVVFWMLSYKIWPIGIFLELPLISQVQNSRFSAIAAFSTVVLFAITIDNISYLVKKRGKFVLSFGFASLVMLLVALAIELAVVAKLNVFQHPYVPHLVFHIVFLSLTTLLFVVALYFRKKKNYFIFLLTVLVVLQTGYLLIGYIPFLRVSYYYPKPPIIDKIQNNERGSVLEVGNPSLIPNINLVYGISSAQNYDAIEIKDYREEFDKAFPIKNHWGKVEQVDYSSLLRFGVFYVISDYNINYQRQVVQGEYSELLKPLADKQSLTIYFRPKFAKLREIRFLTANFNRKNTCNISILLLDEENESELVRKKINCINFLDKMFFTLDVGTVELSTNKEYIIKIYSDDANEQNNIGFWGFNGKPFIQLYFEDNLPKKYHQLYDGQNAKLFKVDGSQKVIIDGKYSILKDDANELIFNYTTTKSNFIEVKKTFYPGWDAYIDGRKTQIRNSHPFVSIYVPSGSHVVSLKYNPQSFKLGVIISSLTLIVLVLLLRTKKLP